MGKTKRKHICLLFSRNSKADRERLVGVLSSAGGRRDWDVRILNASSPDFTRECRRMLVGWMPDGIVYSDPRACRRLLKEVGTDFSGRLVEIDYHTPDLTPDVRITVDDELLARKAVGLFLNRGYRSIAFYGSALTGENAHAARRLSAARGAALADGAEFSFFEPGRAHAIWSEDLEHAAAWLKSLSKPCGVLAYADEEARDVYDACRVAGLSIPEQVAVIGIDNELDLCESSRPTLTSIQPAFERSGILAAEALADCLSGKLRRTARLQTYGIDQIVERASTHDVRGFRRLAVAVDEILRKEAFGPLTVAELARRLNTSTRTLQLSYRKACGETISRRLQNLRLSRIKDLLLKTELPITEVALSAGYSTLASAQSAFRRQSGVSMRDYRKRSFPESSSGSRPAAPVF